MPGDQAVKLLANICRIAKPLIHDVRRSPLQSIGNCERSKVVEQLGPGSYVSTLQDLLERLRVAFASQAGSDEFSTVWRVMECLLKVWLGLREDGWSKPENGPSMKP